MVQRASEAETERSEQNSKDAEPHPNETQMGY